MFESKANRSSRLDDASAANPQEDVDLQVSFVIVLSAYHPYPLIMLYIPIVLEYSLNLCCGLFVMRGKGAHRMRHAILVHLFSVRVLAL